MGRITQMPKGKFFILTLLVLGLDHLAKYRISTSMVPGDVIEILPGYFRVSYVLNSGVAFGLLQETRTVWKPYLLAALAVVAFVVIVVYSSRMPAERSLLQVALAITSGGILGNFIDRITRGSVVDFIELHIRDRFHWPTFNIADSAITIGIALLLIDTLFHHEREVGQEEARSLQP